MNSTAEWCTVCQNTQDRGCGAIAAAAAQARADSRDRISPVGAGFLGAGVTLAVITIMFGMLAFLGILTLGKGRRHKKKHGSDVSASDCIYRRASNDIGLDRRIQSRRHRVCRMMVCMHLISILHYSIVRYTDRKRSKEASRFYLQS